MSLQRVLGRTAHSNAGFCAVGTEHIAYPAGCVVVLENVRSGQQRFFHSPNEKTVACCAASQDGQYLAAGQVGKDPAVVVFDVPSGEALCEMNSHRFGIVALAFSPNGRAIASVGKYVPLRLHSPPGLIMSTETMMVRSLFGTGKAVPAQVRTL